MGGVAVGAAAAAAMRGCWWNAVCETLLQSPIPEARLWALLHLLAWTLLESRHADDASLCRTERLCCPAVRRADGTLRDRTVCIVDGGVR